MEGLRRSDPHVVGGYRLLGRLGSGGMGTVYLARTATGKRLAVKVIRPELAEDDTFRRRFQREVAAASTLGALFTAAVVDADADADPPWFATTFIDGPGLSGQVRSHGPLPVETVLILAAGVCEALAAMHAVELVHRDIKPGNILLTDQGAHVIDFGLVLPAGATRLSSGLIVGTPAYLAPERIDGGEGTTASDIFSLGATMVFAATGHDLVAGATMHEQIAQLARGRFDLDDVPRPLRPLITRCIDRNPDHRPTATELVRVLVGSHVPHPYPGWYGPAAARPRPPTLRLPGGALTRRRVLLGGGVVATVTAGAFAWLGGLPTGVPAPDPTLAPRAPTATGDPPAQEPTVLWQARVGQQPAVIAEHDLIVDLEGIDSDDPLDGTLVGYDRTGSERWRRPVVESARLQVWHGLLVVEDSASIVVIDQADGATRFEIPLDHGSRSLRSTVAGDLLLVSRTYSTVRDGAPTIRALDRSGDEMWAWHQPDGFEPSVEGVVADERTAVVAIRNNQAGSLVGVDVETGDTTWVTASPYPEGPPDGYFEWALHADVLLVWGNGPLYALDRMDGTTKILAEDPEVVVALDVASTVAATPELLILTDTFNGLVHAVDAADGSTAWTRAFGPGAAVASDTETGRIFTAIAGQLHELSAATGESLWSWPLPGSLQHQVPDSLPWSFLPSLHVIGGTAYLAFHVPQPQQGPNAIAISLP